MMALSRRCSICSKLEMKDSAPLLCCCKCNVLVHAACFGGGFGPKLTLPPLLPRGCFSRWECMKCATGAGPTEVPCILCPSRGGALSKLTNGAWVHILCAQFMPSTERTKEQTLEEPSIINLRAIGGKHFKHSCYICKEDGGEDTVTNSTLGAVIFCYQMDCTLAFHVTCGQRRGLLVQRRGRITQNGGFCQEHFEKKMREQNRKRQEARKRINSSKI